MTDQDLFVAFAQDRSSEAFGELARRHAPMVHAVCLRLLRDHAEAEDAAQAVFLVLWRKGAAVSDGAAVGAWLHRVAELTARSYRKVRARRRRHEGEAAQIQKEGLTSTGVTASMNEMNEGIRDHIDAAVAALPPRHRAVVVLHYLEGRTQVEIAAELGVHVKTVAQRLRVALDALRGRLARRGVEVSGVVLTAWLAERGVEAMPEQVISSIAAACGGEAAAAGTIAEAADAVLQALAWGKVKVAAGALAAAILAVSGTTVYLSMTRSPGNHAPAALIDAATPWRAYLVQGFPLSRDAGRLHVRRRHGLLPFDPAAPDEAQAGLSPMPPADWMKADFDDRSWARYRRDELDDHLGRYGVMPQGDAWPALLCLRSFFGVTDPAQAANLKVTVTCIGGVVVYVNGREAGRGFMPGGAILPLTAADDYPPEVYVAEDGTTILPSLKRDAQPDPKWLDRYRKRLRAFSVSVPAQALVKGRNVLAVELHRSAITGPLDPWGRNWSHLGICDLRLSGAGGAGVIPYAEGVKGTRVWSAQNVEAVTETAPEGPVAWRIGTVGAGNTLPVKGTAMGSPHDPVTPVRILVPRNGVGSGQTVLSDPAGLKGVAASAGPFQGPSGSTLPAGSVQIRYAAPHAGVHYCDALMETPPEGAKTVPVWLIVEAPKDATPGWYTSTLELAANGKRFRAPVQALVSGFGVPDAKDFSSTVCAMHSLDALVHEYGVAPLSDAHFQVMEKSLALMGQLGNDIVVVPVLTRNALDWRTPLIRFVKADGGLKPDFSALERYLDLYLKYCAPPRALSVYLWDARSAEEVAEAYEGRQIASRDYQPACPPTIGVWDPAARTLSNAHAPFIGEEGSEAFYKPLLEGVREIVKRRGWSERILMLALGTDIRPSLSTGERFRRWAPYARWHIDSHFSGDPGSMFYDRNKGPDDDLLKALKSGTFIAVGNLEVGVKQDCGVAFAQPTARAEVLEKQLDRRVEYLELFLARGACVQTSAPLRFRTLPTIHMQAGLGDLGLDFWPKRPHGPPPYSPIRSLTAPGPAGAIPTVRFQMLREGVQEREARMAVVKALKTLPEARRNFFVALLDENLQRYAWGSAYLSQHELAWDWPGYAARIYEAAAEVTGVKMDATWESPPK